RRGDEDEVDVRGLQAGGLERAAAGFQREVARGLRFFRDVALPDAGALLDPGVAGLEPGREVVVGDDLGRQVAAGPGDARIDHAPTPAMRSVIRRTTSLR